MTKFKKGDVVRLIENSTCYKVGDIITVNKLSGAGCIIDTIGNHTYEDRLELIEQGGNKMEGRIYFKNKPKEAKFVEIAKELGADYVEDGVAVFKIPKIKGYHQLALGLHEGCVKLGYMEKGCDNFVQFEDSDVKAGLVKGEMQFVIQVFKRLMDNKKVKLRLK